jgi:hypothetical protein
MEKTLTLENRPDAKKMAQAMMTMITSQPFVKVILGFWIFIILAQFIMPILGMPDDMWFLRPLIFAVVILVMYFFTKRSTYNALIKNPKSLETQTFKFDEQGFTVAGQTYSSEFSWSNIPKIVETKDCFLIHLQKISAFVIDKSQLSQAEYTELKQYFSSLPVKTKLKS